MDPDILQIQHASDGATALHHDRATRLCTVADEQRVNHIRYIGPGLRSVCQTTAFVGGVVGHFAVNQVQNPLIQNPATKL